MCANLPAGKEVYLDLVAGSGEAPVEEVGGLHARVASCSSGQVVALPEAVSTPWVNWLLRQDPASSLLQLLSEARTTAQQRCQGHAMPVSRACCIPKSISCRQSGGICP